MYFRSAQRQSLTKVSSGGYGPAAGRPPRSGHRPALGIAGALEDTEYIDKLAKAGFESIDIEPTRIYNIEDARAFLTGKGIDVDAIAPQVEGKFMSAFVRAAKPKTSTK